MPSRGKPEDFDPNKSDSADSDYDAATTRPTRRAAKNHRSKPARKKQRTDYGRDGSDGISESEPSDASEAFVEENEDETPEVDERTGRPKRKATKERKIYRESEDSGTDLISEEEEIERERPRKRQKVVTPGPKKLIVKLQLTNTRRSTRRQSGSAGNKRPLTAETKSGTRHSGRISRDDSEPIIALTNSGRNVEVIRPGTKSPEAMPQRITKGSKGIKKPPSAIFEGSEESSIRTKGEPEDMISNLDRTREIAASRDDMNDEDDDMPNRFVQQLTTDSQDVMQEDAQEHDAQIDDSAIVPESGEETGGEDEDDQDVLNQPRRGTRRSGSTHVQIGLENKCDSIQKPYQVRSPHRALRSGNRHVARGFQKNKKRGLEESSDFEPGPDEGAEENVSDSGESHSSPRKASQDNDSNDSSNARMSHRAGKARVSSRRAVISDAHDSAEEIAEELEDLQPDRSRRRARAEIVFDERPTTRKRKPVDYRILRPDLNLPVDDEGPTETTPSRRGKASGGGGWQRPLFSTYGPFGGAGGLPPVFAGPGVVSASGRVESDSSDDDIMQQPKNHILGGVAGMTPTTAAPPGFGLFPVAPINSADPLQAGVSSLGKIKDRQALADVDALGVDQNVNFDSVGGLQGHIDQLKEMVALPLLYPEVFQRFHVTPPRGVLFHGPPGTGKTLLARALASSVSSQGKKVTFYMRKGGDALSKWVGEAEKQLRLLFEEARKTQPSIIFFDEIDGLAPVRSSKQDQIHSSIVSTLLALMDGMDGRGQVIVIGATNRPDSIDPALRRPGRFDREFYFPLPNVIARRKILDIHTMTWEPPVSNNLKDELAELTKGYGGADLRALCTEAALNAVQRRYPQIYTSNEKLQIKPETITIAPKDFMISIKKIVPSSQRSATSGAAPLPKSVEPLLRASLERIKNLVSDLLPQKKQVTALEEAQFEDAQNNGGMDTERMQQEFERSRIFRPRLLIRGSPGMGQQYLAAALLNHLDGLHVQSFDLPSLLSDATRSPEATTVQFFTEVRRHKPAVIYIANVDVWYKTVGDTVISTFLSMLRSLAPSDPVLLLGVIECENAQVEQRLLKDFFGISKKHQVGVEKPDEFSRREYFTPVIDYLGKAPTDFPDPTDRKKRIFEALPVVPQEPPKLPEPPTKDELKAQKKKDRQTLNYLKVRIQPIMDQVRLKYKRFRTGVIDENQIKYLYEEDDPSIVSTDLPREERQAALFRPYEKGKDDHGEHGLVEQASGKFYYNMEIVTIEKRLSNGYYKRPKDYLADIKRITKDSKTYGDADRLLKANELLSNVEVDIGNIELEWPLLALECEAVYRREVKRAKEMMEKLEQVASDEHRELRPLISNVPPVDAASSTEPSTGPITLGQPFTNGFLHQPLTPPGRSQPSTLTNGGSHKEISDLSDLQGHHQNSNGTSIPAHDDDINMTNSEDGRSQRDTQNSSFGPSAQTRPLHFRTGAPASLQQRLSVPGSLSQRSAITPMAEGSNPQMYDNSASTTSSDKRMTGSSGPFDTQSSLKKNEGPDFSILPSMPSANSQLPDTQHSPQNSRHGSQISIGNADMNMLPAEAPHSQTSIPNSSQSQSSQHTPPVPVYPRPVGIRSLLNAPPPNEVPSSTPSHPLLVPNFALTQDFLDNLVEGTRYCSVEQLEQVYSVLMSGIWKTRGEWNRVNVLEELRKALTNVLDDMKEYQGLGQGCTDSNLSVL